MSEAPYEPSAAERELLLVLAEEQERWERGEWDSRTTLWSRVSYRMGKARDKLTPTHIPGKFNLDRVFEVTFRRLVHRLFKQGLVRLRPIGDQAEERPRQTLGYRAHEARTRDLFLTDAGRALAAALRPPAPAPRPEPDGEVGRQEAPRPQPDGDVGRQAPPVSAPRQEVAEVVVARPEGATRPRVARAERPTRVRRRS
ncbi:MAG: hypothetical protein H6745_22775 [Deltaproteobacteria bacterium]|nr:hypothetical protein [Deltaproteobacteria bacterium]